MNIFRCVSKDLFNACKWYSIDKGANEPLNDDFARYLSPCQNFAADVNENHVKIYFLTEEMHIDDLRELAAMLCVLSSKMVGGIAEELMRESVQ